MNLYDYCKEQGIKVNLACEVGFYRLKDSQIKGFIKAGTKCIVVDIILNPNDREKYCNVDFHCIGIGFEISEKEIFSGHGASTYMSGINSPFIVNQGNKKNYTVC